MPIRSSIYLSGNKFKLFDQIKPYLIREGRDTLLDVFTGSGCITLNCANESLFKDYIANDAETWLTSLHICLKQPEFLLQVVEEDKKYPSTKEGYLKLRKDYNKNISDYAKLFCLMLRSNNNQVRFSGQGDKLKYNMPYGERNRLDTPRMLKHNILTLKKDIEILNLDFEGCVNAVDAYINWNKVVVYMDSPYFGTTATYNSGWYKEDDERLREVALGLHKLGAHIVMSNIFYNKGYTSTDLIEWCEENKESFEVVHLNIDYSNSSSFKYTSGKTDEVLIVSKRIGE